jgi:aryl-alcohol dehydrogenase-like predicted oxidoreductase
MIDRDFGRTGWQVSVVGMGTWNIGNQWGELDDATAWGTVRSAFDHGVTLFDTAESYGTLNGLSEERLGVALAGIRHRVCLVSKIGHWGKRTGQGVPKTTVDMIRLCAHASLHRLRTDWLDVVLCHEHNIEDPSIYLEAFEVLKQRGRIRAYGISTDSLEVLKRFNVNSTCSVVQCDYSLLNRAPEADILPYCQENGIAVMVRGPLAMGLLSGNYSADTVFTDPVRTSWHKDEEAQAAFERRVAQVEKLKQVVKPGQEMVTTALRYVISNPVVSTVIPGAKSPAQAATNAQAGAATLSPAEIDRLVAIIDG